MSKRFGIDKHSYGNPRLYYTTVAENGLITDRLTEWLTLETALAKIGQEAKPGDRILIDMVVK